MGVEGEDSTLSFVTTPTASASSEILSPYLPIIFELTRPLSNLENVFVQAEVQWGTANTAIATIKKEEITVSGTDLFRFEIGNLLQTVLESELLSMGSSTTIQTGNESVAAKFKVLFTQIYIDDFGTRIVQSQALSGDYWVGNSTVQFTDSNQDLTEHIMTGTGNTFLTNIPNESLLFSNDVVQLSFYVPNDSDSYAMYYEEYNIAGAAQGTTTTASTTVDNRYGILPINSAKVLGNFANMSKVDVWLQNTTTAARVSEKKTFVMNHGGCSGVRIMWLNSLGGIDQYTFQNDKRVGHTFDSVIMKKPLSLDYDRVSRGMKTIGTSSVDSWYVSSEFLTEEYILWLNEILTSPEVWHLVSINVRTSIVTTNKKMISVDKFELSNFELTFDVARSRITHIG